MIAQFADDLASGDAPVLYSDGTQTRDFTYVDDIVRGLVTAAERELTGVYNLRTGTQVSFNELVKMLNDELGIDVKPKYTENPIPDDVYVHDTMADCSAMHEATGWKPKISLEEGVERVCASYTARPPQAD